jgi:hypothetical protein
MSLHGILPPGSATNPQPPRSGGAIKGETMIKTAPRISKSAAEFIPEYFRTLNAGLEYIIDSWPVLYRYTLDHLKKHFSRGELMLMIDVFNATALTPRIAGQHIQLSVDDGMKLDRLDEKWNVNRNDLNAKLESCTIFERACLEIWANGFWYGGPGGENRDIEKYVDEMV